MVQGACDDQTVRVAVFGLGYVGCVTAACLADRGHAVVGVDVNPLKVDAIRRGSPPVLEAGLAELVSATVAAGALSATDDAEAAVLGADLSLVCVGTPSLGNGGLDVRALERVAERIGSALPRCSERHTVVVRSTVLPGTIEDTVVPLLEKASGLRAGEHFGVASNPEFLREGTSVHDFSHPPKTVIGQLDDASGEAVGGLYEGIDAPLYRVPLRVAETVKYVDNAFHALKIGFANEVGALCSALDVDAHEVMSIFRADRKLNISTAYLKPGFAFGGSCLPKDLRALVHAARRVDVDLPILESVLFSNEKHLGRTLDTIVELGLRRVGLLGLAFKPGTDDLRESPLVELAERLLGKGFDLRIYDPAVSLARLVGANREFIEERIPHLSTLLVPSVGDAVEHAEICVLGTSVPEAVEAVETAGSEKYVLDLLRAPDAVRPPRISRVGAT
jgi:GDP-mannose 6-dehydrogenase